MILWVECIIISLAEMQHDQQRRKQTCWLISRWKSWTSGLQFTLESNGGDNVVWTTRTQQLELGRNNLNIGHKELRCLVTLTWWWLWRRLLPLWLYKYSVLSSSVRKSEGCGHSTHPCKSVGWLLTAVSTQVNTGAMLSICILIFFFDLRSYSLTLFICFFYVNPHLKCWGFILSSDETQRIN